MRGLLFLLAIVSLPVAAGVEVYRSVAPDGTVIYSDVPEGAHPKRVELQVHAAAQPSIPATGHPSQGRSQSPSDASPKAAEPSAVQQAQIDAERCKQAKDRSQRYSVAHRLYRNLPDGQREYLSSAEIDKARSQAAVDVERWCK